MNLPTSQILPREFISALRLEARQYVKAEKEHSKLQWRIGELVHDGMVEHHGSMEEFWTSVVYELSSAADGWVAFSDSNVKRWERTYRRFEHVDKSPYISKLSFEHFAVAGEIVSAGGSNTVIEPLEWALSTGGSAEDMKLAFRKKGKNAPGWDRGVKIWADFFEAVKEWPAKTQEKLRPHIEAISQIIEESEAL